MRIQTSSAPLDPPHILLVDDNRQGLIARRSLLQEIGYRVSTATNGEEALELFSKQKFDVVVTDFRMPRMDGRELIRHLRTAEAGARIIMLSGFVEALGLNAESTGADVVISKNAAEVGNLTRSVKRLLNQATRKPPLSVRATAKKARA